MERTDVAYLVNSTPKYYYLLPLHFALIRRYGAAMKWPIYVASEVPTDPTLLKCKEDYGIEILPLQENDKYFLESRLAAVKALPANIKYVFPIQEDFLLQGRPDAAAIEEALNIFDTDRSVATIRLMPCPGPVPEAAIYKTSQYRILNEYVMFSYQATFWKREQYCLYLSAILDLPEEMIFSALPTMRGVELPPIEKRKKFIQVDINIAEIQLGQAKFREILGKYTHLAYPRSHPKPNAVYLCPWPYRPTAVERGKVGKWVYEFAEREGFPILE